MIGLGLGLTLVGGGGSASLFDLYVDSVAGDDGNNGASPAAAFETLAAAVAVAGNGIRIGLTRGSTWREEFDLDAYSGVAVEAYGTGDAPVITGFDIHNSGWTNDGTYTNLWYKDIAHNANGTNRQAVLDDNVMMRRVASVATANSTTRGYYSADCGTANPIRVYIHTGGTNPNSNGHTYEVTTRRTAGYFGPSSVVSGIVFRGAISNNGPLESGKGSTITQCLAAFGTKHNALVASGSVTDCVFFDSDAVSVSEPSIIPFVAYAATLSGESITLTRCMFWNQYAFSDLIYSHTGNDPTASIDLMTVDQCVGHADVTLAGGTGIVAASDVCVATNCCFTGKMNGLFAPYSPISSATRLIGEVTSDVSAFQNQGTGTALAISQCAISRNTVSGGTRGFVEPKSGQTITAENCSFDSLSDFYGQAMGLVSATAYTIGYNRMVVEANNAVSKHASSTMTATDNNVYSRPGGGIGPFATWQGTGYNLTIAMAVWRTASGNDATSIAVTTSPFTGTTTDGDFTVSSAAQIGGIYCGATEHWDFNARAVVSTPPTRWAVGPRTYAESLTYIEDPEAWDFYP